MAACAFVLGWVRSFFSEDEIRLEIDPQAFYAVVSERQLLTFRYLFDRQTPPRPWVTFPHLSWGTSPLSSHLLFDMPITWHFRWLEFGFGETTRTDHRYLIWIIPYWSISTDAVVDTAHCIVLEEMSQLDGNNIQRRFWCDPQRDFLILRATVCSNGVIREQSDIQYKQTEGGAWIPTSWTSIAKPTAPAATISARFPGDDWLYSLSSSTVLDCRVDVTPEAPPGEVEFSIGAILYERATKLWSRQVSSTQRELLSSDEIRAITHGDY
jgi:hypothetical protein